MAKFHPYRGSIAAEVAPGLTPVLTGRESIARLAMASLDPHEAGPWKQHNPDGQRDDRRTASTSGSFAQFVKLEPRDARAYLL